MSVYVSTIVWQYSEAKLSNRLLMLAIADFADDRGGNAYPSVATLAAKTKTSDRQVRTGLRELEAAGELAVSVGTGPHGCNEYRVLLAERYSLQPKQVKHSRLEQSSPLHNVPPAQCSPLNIVPLPLHNIPPPPAQYSVTPCTIFPQSIIDPPVDPSVDPSMGIDAQGVSKPTVPKPTVPKPIRLKTNAKAVALQKSEKGSRIPDDWQPSREAVAAMREQFPQIDFRAATDEFRDYWAGVPNPHGLKSDWLATWRNNMRDKHAQGRCRVAAPGSPELPIPRRSGHTTTEQARANVARTVNQLLTEGDGFD